jgi:hypothetical protein
MRWIWGQPPSQALSPRWGWGRGGAQVPGLTPGATFCRPVGAEKSAFPGLTPGATFAAPLGLKARFRRPVGAGEISQCTLEGYIEMMGDVPLKGTLTRMGLEGGGVKEQRTTFGAVRVFDRLLAAL